MTKIYIVQGTTGAYRSEWLVCAYASKELAEEHASRATIRDMQVDYTGVEYFVLETELRESIVESTK